MTRYTAENEQVIIFAPTVYIQRNEKYEIEKNHPIDSGYFLIF